MAKKLISFFFPALPILIKRNEYEVFLWNSFTLFFWQLRFLWLFEYELVILSHHDVRFLNVFHLR